MGISHFSRILVISSFFKSSSGCFSFSLIFSFLAIFPVLQWTFLNFLPFSVFLAIFQVLKCVFLIFCDFQFSRHIQGPSVCICHFSRFLVISSFFKSTDFKPKMVKRDILSLFILIRGENYQEYIINLKLCIKHISIQFQKRNSSRCKITN